MLKETHGEWEEVPAQGANSPSYPSLGVSPFGISLDYLSDGLTGDPHSDQPMTIGPYAQIQTRMASKPAPNARPLALLNRETDRPRARNTGGAVRKAVCVRMRKAVATPRADQA